VKIPNEFLDKLSAVIDSNNIILDTKSIEPYSHDETPDLQAYPDIVVKPENKEQVEKIVRLCYEYNIPITPRGAGTGVAGGSVPVVGGLVLSMERIDKIIDIDKGNMVAIVQPGLITGNLRSEVEKMDLYYPPDPASVDSCSIGGNVATCAGGMRAYKYGTTGKFVQGIKAILPPGNPISLGGRMIKDVAGYNLPSLLVGSEGTLGILTELTLRLVAKPTFSVDLLAGFESFEQGADALLTILPETGIHPAAMEFMEGEIVPLVEAILEEELPFHTAAVQTIVSFEGFSEEQTDNAMEVVGEHLLNKGAIDVLVAINRQESERLWRARRNIRDAIRHRSPSIMAEDVAVPPTKVPELMVRMKKIGEINKATILGFGHIGDGNVHVDLLRDDMNDSEWENAKEIIVPKMLGLAVELGGTITGEHGIGFIKRKYLKMFYQDNFVSSIASIKKALDPRGLMNPQKVIV